MLIALEEGWLYCPHGYPHPLWATERSEGGSRVAEQRVRRDTPDLQLPPRFMHMASARVAVANISSRHPFRTELSNPRRIAIGIAALFDIGVGPRFRPLFAFGLYVTCGPGPALELVRLC